MLKKMNEKYKNTSEYNGVLQQVQRRAEAGMLAIGAPVLEFTKKNVPQGPAFG